MERVDSEGSLTERWSFVAYICATYQKTAPVMGVQSNNINTYVAADLDYANAKKVEATINTKTALWIIPLIKNGKKTFKSSNRYSGLSK